MDKDELLKRVEAGEFIANNGKVLRTINIIKGKYVRLSSLIYALPDIDKGEIFKSVNFLFEEGYIHIREYKSKSSANISDYNFEDLEAMVSGKGIRLLCRNIKDDVVKT